MNQQHYQGGLSPFSSEPLVKRRRGRPRKEDTLANTTAKLTPIKPPQALGSQVLTMQQTTQSPSCAPLPFQPQADLSKGKAHVEDATSNGGGAKDDEMIGQVVTGVLEGMFDAGYFLSVKVGESDTQLRGLVFQPGKLLPVTKENDIAPGAKMYSRVDVCDAGLKSPNQVHDSTISSSKLVECADVSNVRPVEPVCFDLQPTLEKNGGELEENKREEGKVIDLEADKEHDPILVERSSLVDVECESSVVKEGPILNNGMNDDEVKDMQKQGLELQDEKRSDQIIIEEPSEVFLESEGFVPNGEDLVKETDVEEVDGLSEKAANGDEKNLAADEQSNEVVEENNKGVVAEKNNEVLEKLVVSGHMNEHFDSPRLELALSNSAFDVLPIDHSKLAVEKNLQLDEGQQKIPQPNLDPLASSVTKDVLKISIDVDEGQKIHVEAYGQSNEDVGEGNKDENPSVAVPSFQLFEEMGSGREDDVLESLAKKPKIDETVHFTDVASSEGGLQTEDMTVAKEVVDGQGFINLACLNNPMKTD